MASLGHNELNSCSVSLSVLVTSVLPVSITSRASSQDITVTRPHIVITFTALKIGERGNKEETEVFGICIQIDTVKSLI